MNRTADIVIAGAGVVGMSIAVQLARRSRARIMVLERASGLGHGSTGASSAVCRHKYSRDETMMLARDGIAAYRDWPAFLELSDPLAAFQDVGVLWPSDGRPDWPAQDARRMARLGVRAAVIDDAELAARFPAINPCPGTPDPASGHPHVCGAGGPHLLELDGGFIDPVDVLSDLVRSARQKGVDIHFGTGVDELQVEGGRVTGVRLSGGTSVDCPVVVSATGPWCVRWFERIGLRQRWRLEPTRVQVAHLDRPADVAGALPVVCDPGAGIYFRPQNRGQQIVVGSVREEDEREVVPDPDDYAAYADDDFMRTMLYALEHRVRGLSQVGRPRGYSGLYTVNRMDFHPVVGPAPIDGLIVANGFSGHGFKLAPAIGALVARMLVGAADSFDTSVSPDFLALDREPIAMDSRGVLA